MFSSSGPSYTKLKTNLRLAINRLKLLEKKKTELAQKARKEIADYLATGKAERAKIRVEHIIREDYLVEAMEVVEMYCDLLLARFGLIQQMKDLDEGLAEAISSLIWVSIRLQTDVQELKIISDNLALKYGKPYAQACREQAVSTISPTLIHKLSVQAPPKVLVEKYLVEIAKNYNVEYEPDPQTLRESEDAKNPLIALDNSNENTQNSNNSSGGANGGMGLPAPPPAGFAYQPPCKELGGGFDYPQASTNLPLSMKEYQPDLSDFVPSILLINPQSLINCFPDFVARIKEYDPDVIGVSETWFSNKHPAGRFQVDGYVLFHDDREDRRGGGVALYVKTKLVPFSPSFPVPDSLECIWACVGSSLFICSLYHAPRAPTGKLLMEHLTNTIVDIRSTSRSPVWFIVIGDFNELPHERLYSALKLQNLVKEPTHHNSVLDLILTDFPQFFAEPKLLSPLSQSQHHCVFVSSAQAATFPSNFLPSHMPMTPIPPPADVNADTLPEKYTPTTPKTEPWTPPDLDQSPPPPYYSATPPTVPSAPGSTYSHRGVGFPPDVSLNVNPSNGLKSTSPKPAPRSKFDAPNSDFQLPDLPSVPHLPSVPKTGKNDVGPSSKEDDDIDFDDLNKRFEMLKKRK